MKDLLKFYSLSEIDYRHKYPLIEKIKYFAKGILLYFVLQICALLLMLLVDDFLIKKMGFASVFKLMMESQKNIKGYYGIFIVVILGPLVEELIFRLILVPKRRNIAIFTFVFSFLVLNKTYYIIKIDWLLLVSLVVSGLLSFLVFNLLKRNPEIEIAIGKRQKIITMVSVVLFGLLHIANIENLHWELALLYPVYALPQMILGYIFSVQRLKLGFIWGLLFHSMNNLMVFLR
jgi:putative membrane protein